MLARFRRIPARLRAHSLRAAAAAGLLWCATTAADAPRDIPVCYDFGCSTRTLIALTDEEWKMMGTWFDPVPPTPAAEREQIRKAVGWMEILVGQRTPTHLDKALDRLIPSDSPGQMDCIDESLNTTTYLKLFERAGWLHHHRVIDRAYRAALLDQHWSAQIEETNGGDRYVVDSWFADNGYMPFVQPTREWMKIPYFGTTFSSTF